IRHLQKTYGNCHVMSVCQPTVPVLAAVSLMASRGELTPLSMTMMGGPIDARKSPTSVNHLAVNKSHNWFESNVIYRVPSSFPGAGRRVYPGFLQHSGFIAMNPDNHAQSHYDYFQDLIKGDDTSTDAHRKFYDEYNAVLDMDADYYLDTIKVVFQDFSLVNGTWDVRNPDGKSERVRPQDIKNTALFSIEGELDDISGSGQTHAVHEICTGVSGAMQKRYDVEGAGHYGIFSGRRWREMVYPQVKAFILKYQPETSLGGVAVVPAKGVVAKPRLELVTPAELPLVAPVAPAIQKAGMSASRSPAAKKVAARRVAAPRGAKAAEKNVTVATPAVPPKVAKPRSKAGKTVAQAK
ncbi:MAG TPA: polyhydroxyalkanoate depolymerase, partial [Burkholderiaceae bacterium]|nr:polyhydroxyalkanoate depolymerase [Burkholderiaceae bacterium]